MSHSNSYQMQLEWQRWQPLPIWVGNQIGVWILIKWKVSQNKFWWGRNVGKCVSRPATGKKCQMPNKIPNSKPDNGKWLIDLNLKLVLWYDKDFWAPMSSETMSGLQQGRNQKKAVGFWCHHSNALSCWFELWLWIDLQFLTLSYSSKTTLFLFHLQTFPV